MHQLNLLYIINSMLTNTYNCGNAVHSAKPR